MIFSMGNHIEKIVQGIKTQTRRLAAPQGPIYEIGKTYAIQSGRGKHGISEGRIKIINRRLELRQDLISVVDAWCEGGYTPDEYEALFEKMYPYWRSRYAYAFKFVRTNGGCEKTPTAIEASKEK